MPAAKGARKQRHKQRHHRQRTTEGRTSSREHFGPANMPRQNTTAAIQHSEMPTSQFPKTPARRMIAAPTNPSTTAIIRRQRQAFRHKKQRGPRRNIKGGEVHSLYLGDLGRGVHSRRTQKSPRIRVQPAPNTKKRPFAARQLARAQRPDGGQRKHQTERP